MNVKCWKVIGFVGSGSFFMLIIYDLGMKAIRLGPMSDTEGQVEAEETAVKESLQEKKEAKFLRDLHDFYKSSNWALILTYSMWDC